MPTPPYASFLNTMGQIDHLSALDAAGMAERYTRAPNDDWVNRINLTGASFRVAGTVAGTDDYSVWYSWTAPASSFVTIGTSDSQFYTALAIYTGESLPNLTFLASGRYPAGGVLLEPLSRESRITFYAMAGRSYSIAVSALTAGDTFYLNGELNPTPSNDSFASPTELFGASGVVTGTNAGATREPGEPIIGDYNNQAASVWYSWTAPASGRATFDTRQNNFFTKYAIYTGTTLATLNGVGSNFGPSGVVDEVSFGATAGQTYRIVVHGYIDGQNNINCGNVVLRWSLIGQGTDFNNDGQSDLLWQNNATGQRGIWLMNGTASVVESFLPTVALEWQIAGTGDFNSDGQTDIVWQNSRTGQRGIWLMAGTTYSSAVFLPNVAAEWQIATTGDFNQDGQTDLVWQNSVTGERGIWLMNGTTLAQVVFLPTIPLEWRIVGAGDFTGDRQADLLWENRATGEHGVWRMNGTTFAEAIYLPTAPTQWRIAGTGDFNEDGFVDLLWQNNITGERGLWLMSGTTQVSVSFLPTIPLEWEIVNH